MRTSLIDGPTRVLYMIYDPTVFVFCWCKGELDLLIRGKNFDIIKCYAVLAPRNMSRITSNITIYIFPCIALQVYVVKFINWHVRSLRTVLVFAWVSHSVTLSVFPKVASDWLIKLSKSQSSLWLVLVSSMQGSRD